MGRYTSGILGVRGMGDDKAGRSSELFPAELLRFAGLKRPRLNDEENLRSLRLGGAVKCAGT